MNSFLNLLILIVFATIPVYYLTVLYSIYFKKIYKNRNNLKLSYNINSLGIYIPLIILALLSIAYLIYAYMNNINISLTIIIFLINILVFVCIKLSSSRFCIYDDYVVVKNNYAPFNEIQSVILEQKEKNNKYELKITTKFDLLICTLSTNDDKGMLKSIKSSLPKNIKIKEVPAK